ncbi:hypothetical protein [Clostridium sp.]|uniref:hypothetical protein n=1 Tax=Clostridium sp. TaxID=1506 RepID=UPI001A5632CB|nr:hypothetical protein [Clostridium sp.]MBK5236683.1 hypothetical protein [Clostridium sp.]
MNNLNEKEAAQEGSVQEQSKRNFSAHTGKKLNEVCPKCWVKGNKPYNCGFDKCPGHRLSILEKTKTK